MILLWYICIGISVGLLMGWIFYEKGYVMMAGIITAILGSLIGSGLFQLFSDSLV